jgi:hypothetical protein
MSSPTINVGLVVYARPASGSSLLPAGIVSSNPRQEKGWRSKAKGDMEKLIAVGLGAIDPLHAWILIFIAVMFLAGMAVGGVFTYLAMRRKRKP